MKNNVTINTISDNLYFLKILWNINPKRVILTYLQNFLSFAEWVFFTVIFMKYLFGAEDLQRSFEETVIFVLISLVVLACTAGFQIWMEQRYIPMTNPEIYQKLNQMLFDKATNVDISCYENTEFYDTYTKASSEAYTRALSVLEGTATVFSSAFASIYVIGTIFSINWIAGLFSFFPVIGSFWFGKIINRIEYERRMELVPQERRQNYVNRVLYLPKYAKEFRMTKIYHVLEKTYESTCQGMRNIYDKYWKKLFVLGSIRGILCFPVVFEGMWLFAAYCAMVPKTILIGEFVVLANAIVSTTWMLFSFTDSITLTYQNGLYAKNLRAFLNYESKIPEDWEGIPVPEKIETLELRDVSFQYQEQEKEGKYALRHVNYTFYAGKRTALVGHNGSGKSTLIKLLMRLYDPTEGCILLNGIDIRKFNLQAYRKLIGTTFQDFELFSMSVLENVIMEKLETKEQRERAKEALRQSGILEQIEKLEQGLDSVLTREFDDKGVVLSGGQAQKVAVARCFVKDAPIVLLDEPSSALDPVAEYCMYETIMELCARKQKNNGKQEKISIIISHRLSSGAMADVICLLQEGELKEHGTHLELMEKKGIYADMFMKQAESYLQDAASVYGKSDCELSGCGK